MISSHWIQHIVGNEQFLFYDTVLDGKHIFTACGIGRVANNDAELTEVARKTLSALHCYVEDLHGPELVVRLNEIRALKTVGLRVEKALKAANNKEIVFFVCRSSEIYDAAVAMLNVHWADHATLQ